VRKWCFVAAGLVLVAALFILNRPSPADGPIRFLGFETNSSGKILGCFLLSERRGSYVYRARIEKQVAGDWIGVPTFDGMYERLRDVPRSFGGRDISLAVELPLHVERVRLVFGVYEMTVADRWRAFSRRQTIFDLSKDYNKRHYFLTNELPRI
jgi:hypothetical protein